MYFPTTDVLSPAVAGVPAAEIVSFETEDGITLAGWFVPAAVPSRRATVIVFNGNGGNRSYRGPLAAALADAGLSVLLFDYRGYGGNAGAPTEAGLAADARAARAYVASRPDVDPGRIVFFGESLGGAVAIALAAERPPAALILRSPFISATAIGQHHYRWLPVRWLLRDRYPSIDRIGRIDRPVLFIAGDRDSIVPADQTRALYEAAREPKALVIIPGADHNDAALLNGARMIREVLRFLDEHVPDINPGSTAAGPIPQ
jgi:fermentation-respiration switch protein FrsA (DUF1100 family)